MNQDKVGKFLASLRKENNLTQEDQSMNYLMVKK